MPRPAFSEGRLRHAAQPRGPGSKTLLIITYDEHGGFYDHVVPALAEARSLPPVAGGGHDGAGRHRTAGAGQRDHAVRVRVPTFVVSPWVPAGKGPDIVLDHCSILKTVLARFCAAGQPFLSDRVHASHSFDAFLSAAEPRLQSRRHPPCRR